MWNIRAFLLLFYINWLCTLHFNWSQKVISICGKLRTTSNFNLVVLGTTTIFFLNLDTVSSCSEPTTTFWSSLVLTCLGVCKRTPERGHRELMHSGSATDPRAWSQGTGPVLGHCKPCFCENLGCMWVGGGVVVCVCVSVVCVWGFFWFCFVLFLFFFNN